MENPKIKVKEVQVVRSSDYLLKNHLIYHKLDFGEQRDVVLGRSGRDEYSLERNHIRRTGRQESVAHLGNRGQFKGQKPQHICKRY